MINTIVRGIPSTLGPVDVDGKPNICKYVVRSYRLYDGTYVTSVWRLKEAERDFDWAKKNPDHHRFIRDDRKEELMFEVYPFPNRSDNTTYLWKTNQKEIGALHQQVCMEIINGEYWDGDFAYP